MADMTKMAWIARNGVTGECYAACAADPQYADDAAEEISKWNAEGATVELVTKEEAKAAMLAPAPVGTLMA